MSKGICIKYAMCDLICDVISCCVWSCDSLRGEINVYDWKLWLKVEKTREMWKKIFFLFIHLKDVLGMDFTAC